MGRKGSIVVKHKGKVVNHKHHPFSQKRRNQKKGKIPWDNEISEEVSDMLKTKGKWSGCDECGADESECRYCHIDDNGQPSRFRDIYIDTNRDD